MERRWSVVGAPWSRKKHTTTGPAASTRTSRLEDIFGSRKSMASTTSAQAASARFPDSPGSPLPLLLGSSRPRADSLDTPTSYTSAYLDNLRISGGGDGDGAECDFMRISKSEYEAIKERVSAIETRISQEFGRHAADADDGDSSLLGAAQPMDCQPATAAGVQHKYVRTLEHTGAVAAAAAAAQCGSPATDQLAKRLSRELKIRRSAEHTTAAVIRSPSARKIGTMRRRSRDAAHRLSRNFSWHLGASAATHTG